MRSIQTYMLVKTFTISVSSEQGWQPFHDDVEEKTLLFANFGLKVCLAWERAGHTGIKGGTLWLHYSCVSWNLNLLGGWWQKFHHTLPAHIGMCTTWSLQMVFSLPMLSIKKWITYKKATGVQRTISWHYKLTSKIILHFHCSMEHMSRV